MSRPLKSFLSTPAPKKAGGNLNIPAKPFLKWAGGKGQLIGQIDRFFASIFSGKQIGRYIEPFIGGGAVFFHVVQKYHPAEVLIADINPELILAYTCIQKDVLSLIAALIELQAGYHAMLENERQNFYYKIRGEFNEKRGDIDYSIFSANWVERTAQIIFLNHTCYNGLFRVNLKGEFNVPFGRYKNPHIADARNLQQVSDCLQDAKILYRDFTEIEPFVDAGTLVYFDPPYRPISRTANFRAYSKNAFDDADQHRLAALYRILDWKGASLLLSNSDPKNQDPADDFFEQAYQGFRIERVTANRNINSKAGRRGPIQELLILNV